VSVNDVGFFQLSTGYQYFDAGSATGGGLGGGAGTATGVNFSRDAGQTLARVARTAGDSVLFKVAGATTAARTYTYTTAGSQSYRHWVIGNGNVVTADFTTAGTQSFAGDILVQGASTLRWNAANSWIAGSPALLVNDGSVARFANDATATTTLQFAGLSLGAGGNRLETTSGTAVLNLRFTSAAGSSNDVISLATRTILTIDATTSGTLAAAIDGAGSFVKDGSGTLALTSNNAITGTTSVIGGTLLVGAGGTTGAVAGPIAIGSGGTFVYNRSDSDTTYANPISGAGILRKQGAGELGLTGVNSFTGRIVVADGKMAFADEDSENGVPEVAVESGSILSIGSAFVGGTATIGTLSGAGLVDTAFGTTAGTRTLRIDQSANATFSGTLANTTSGSNVRTLAIVKAGAAILTLSGTANTHAGGVRIEAGILRATANGSLGAAGGDITFAAGGSGALMNNAGPLTLDSGRQVNLVGDGAFQAGWSQDITVAGRVSGTGGMTIRSDVTPGWVVFSGVSDYTGKTVVEAGANLRFVGGSNRIRSGNDMVVNGMLDMNANAQMLDSLTGSGSIATGGAVLTVGSAGSSGTFAGVISEGGGLTKTGAGTFTLSGANTYTGTTTIQAGVLRIGTGGNVSATSVIAAGAVLEFNSSGATAGGSISGAGRIVKNGSGTTGFGAQTYTGGLTLNAGGVDLASSGALGSGTFTVNGGAFGATGSSDRNLSNPLVFGGNATLGTAGSSATIRQANYTGPVDLGGATRTLTVSQTTQFNGTISNGGLTIAGNGSYTLTLGGSNTFTGPTTVTSGTLVVNNANALAGSTFGGGAGRLGFGTITTATFGGMSGSANLALVNATAAAVALSVGANGGSTTYSGALSGAGRLAKVGAGTFTLSGANTYTGSTAVHGGSLRLAHAAALASSRVVPLAGGTLTLSPGLQTTIGGLAPAAGGLVDAGSGMVTVAAGLSSADLVTALMAGRGDGSWNGTGGITSSVAAADLAASIPRTVGWLDNGDGSVAVAYSAPGDTNLDWTVDVLDAANFLAGGKFDAGTHASWNEGDFGYDGIVDLLDAADFLATSLFDAGAYNATQATVAAVPEPAGLVAAVLPCAAAWLAMRRRRHR
jgi:autotransporter-associated beta strand protein